MVGGGKGSCRVLHRVGELEGQLSQVFSKGQEGFTDISFPFFPC